MKFSWKLGVCLALMPAGIAAVPVPDTHIVFNAASGQSVVGQPLSEASGCIDLQDVVIDEHHRRVLPKNC